VLPSPLDILVRPTLGVEGSRRSAVVPPLVGTPWDRRIGMERGLGGLGSGLRLRSIFDSIRSKGLEDLTPSVVTTPVGPFPPLSGPPSLSSITFHFVVANSQLSTSHKVPLVYTPCFHINMYHHLSTAALNSSSCSSRVEAWKDRDQKRIAWSGLVPGGRSMVSLGLGVARQETICSPTIYTCRNTKYVDLSGGSDIILYELKAPNRIETGGRLCS